MYFELLKAFDKMEETGTTSVPFVDGVGFVSSQLADLAGVTLPIRLSDGVVYERRHRNVLRFGIRTKTRAPRPKIETTSRRNSNPSSPMPPAALRRFPRLLSQCACVTPTRF